MIFAGICLLIFAGAKLAESVDPAGYERFGRDTGFFLIGASTVGIPVGVICWLAGAAVERGRLASQMIRETPRAQEPLPMSLAQEAMLHFMMRNGMGGPLGQQYQLPTRVNQRPQEHTVTIIGGD